MNIATTRRFVCFTTLLLAARLAAAAQNGFTDADADAIRAFLRTTFADGNSGMVIGLLDRSDSRVFGAGKLDDGTDQSVTKAAKAAFKSA